jgi:hypothetical protein
VCIELLSLYEYSKYKSIYRTVCSKILTYVCEGPQVMRICLYKYSYMSLQALTYNRGRTICKGGARIA